jgi:hypothetical protein
MATRIQVVIDCADPDGLAGFWAQALGYHKQDPPQGYASWPAFETAQGVPPDRLHAWHAVVDPDGAGPRLYFHRVPEAKVGKNRLHLDLNVAREVLPEQSRDRIDGEAERLGRLGATRLRAVEEHGEYWVTMLDPEGNEFDLMETATKLPSCRAAGGRRRVPLSGRWCAGRPVVRPRRLHLRPAWTSRPAMLRARKRAS